MMANIMSKQLLTEFFELCPNGRCLDLLNERQKQEVVELGVVYLTGRIQTAGKKNGKGTLTHPSGEKYSGDFKDDKKHGKGYYINPNGMNYDGGYKNDMFHGKGKFVDATGKVIEGTFKEGKLIK